MPLSISVSQREQGARTGEADSYIYTCFVHLLACMSELEERTLQSREPCAGLKSQAGGLWEWKGELGSHPGCPLVYFVPAPYAYVSVRPKPTLSFGNLASISV